MEEKYFSYFIGGVPRSGYIIEHMLTIRAFFAILVAAAEQSTASTSIDVSRTWVIPEEDGRPMHRR
jgi:hypothetical protein